MKNLIKKGLLIVIGISLLAATGEAETGLQQLVWSGGCLIVCAASAAILNTIEKKEEQA